MSRGVANIHWCGGGIHGIAFMVRPLRASRNRAKPQLCRPAVYAEQGDDFTGYTLDGIVALDHVCCALSG